MKGIRREIGVARRGGRHQPVLCQTLGQDTSGGLGTFRTRLGRVRASAKVAKHTHTYTHRSRVWDPVLGCACSATVCEWREW